MLAKFAIQLWKFYLYIALVVEQRMTLTASLPYPVADPEFHNGGRTVEGKGSGEGAVPPPQKKLNFYLKMVGFGAF